MKIPSQATTSDDHYVLTFMLPLLERPPGEAWKRPNQTTLFSLPKTSNKVCLTSPVIFQFRPLFYYAFLPLPLSFFLISVFKHLYKYTKLCRDFPFLITK
jgi:hypothetical protein